MILFPELLFWIYFLLFIGVLFVAFFIPADFFLKHYNFTLFQRITLGICLGMVMWGWQGYIFGYINLRWLSYIYLFIFGIYWLKSSLKKSRKSLPNQHKRISFSIIFIVILGSVIQLSSVWFAGISKNNELYFYTYSLPDNLWYLDLTSEVIKKIPPFEPGMSGKTIENYHYWSNLVMGEVIRVFHLPLIPTVSQYFMLLLSLLLGCMLIVFGQLLNLRKSFVAWIAFFIYFGGDFVNPIQIVFNKTINFSQQSMEDGAKFLANPPRAFALVLLFAAINFLVLYIKKKKNYFLGIINVLVLSSLVGFKVYVGFFGLVGIVFLGLYYLLIKQYKFMVFVALTVVLTLSIYLPANRNAGGLIYTGFWRSEDFISLPSLGLSHLELARQIYASHKNWLRVLSYDLLFLTFLILGTFGTKLIGILQNRSTLKLLPKELNIFLVSGLGTSFILGTFFIQVSGGSNAFNFLASVYVVGSIYAGIATAYWLNRVNPKIKFVLIIILIFLTIPRATYQILENINGLYESKGYRIEDNEMEALGYLRKNTSSSSLILVQPNISYLSFISQRSAFLYGSGILETHGVDFSGRVKTQKNVFNSNDPLLAARELSKNKIDYIYMYSDAYFLTPVYKKFLDTVYDNKGIQILKIKKERL